MIFVPLSSPASRPPSGRGLTALRTNGSGVPHPRQVIGGGRQGHLDRHCLQSWASELPHPTCSFSTPKIGSIPPKGERAVATSLHRATLRQGSRFFTRPHLSLVISISERWGRPGRTRRGFHPSGFGSCRTRPSSAVPRPARFAFRSGNGLRFHPPS